MSLARCIRRYCLKNSPNNICVKHHAIIVAISTRKLSHKIIRYFPYSGGAKILVKWFINKKIPFKVYECLNKSDLEKIIIDDNATVLWIFGHGQKNGVNLQKEFFKYSYFDIDVYRKHRKKEINQFHCNKDEGKSLTEILADGNGIDWGYKYCFGICPKRDKKGERYSELNENDINELLEKYDYSIL
ncbi:MULTISPECIES: hypothetical protein [Methanocorpusculum]|jgi:hypothetical protein|uniref:hypothetical protein n=1 Tax=Methanocorpusculum TaxID=2192 RepID=UPI0012DE2FDA|nr:MULTISPECIES: hypothetical protein [Methanocorpusculum]MDD2803772.1 hypothetical protein [Methanocorpusculum sp.]MDY3203215.1 hypothetical protein [Methanocorpusculum sp.]